MDKSASHFHVTRLLRIVSYTNIGFSFLDVGSKGEWAVYGDIRVYGIYKLSQFCHKPTDVEFVFGLSVFLDGMHGLVAQLVVCIVLAWVLNALMRVLYNILNSLCCVVAHRSSV